jgi:uncharacterized protein
MSQEQSQIVLRELPIVFSSEGHLLHGTFFRRSESLSERAPCVVVTGSWLNVKEQMASTWARALAERGLNAFVFDFRGSGESGRPRRSARGRRSMRSDECVVQRRHQR